jgi:prefoldin subunit 5
LEQLDAVRAGVREAIQALNDECKRLSERRDGLNDSIRQKTQELQTAVDHHTAHSKKLEDLLVEHTASIATNKKELEECRVDTENVLTAAKRTITDSPEWTSGQVSVAVAALAHKFDKHVARLGAEMPYDLGNNPDLLEHFDAAYVELQTTFARIEHHHKQTVHNLEARLDEANEHIAAKHDIHERTIRELEDANINLSDETAKTERFDAQVDYWKQKYADLLARDPESARDHTSAVDEIEQLRFELGEKDGIIKFQSGMMAQFHQERTLSVDSLAQIGEAVENKARQLDESTDDSEQKGHPLTGQSGNAEHPDRERDGMMRFIEATGKEISELRDQLWDQYDKTAPAMPTAGDLVARLRSITRENRELREDYHQLLKSVDFNHQLSDVYKAIPRQSGGDLGTPSPTSFSLGSGRSLSPLDTHSPDKIVETVVDAVAPHLDRLKSTHAESRDECRALRWENEELRRRIADLEGTCLRYARDNSLLQNKIAQMVASTHSPSLGEGHATPEYSPSTDSAGGETGDVKKLEATIAQLHVEIGYWRAHKQPGFRNVPRISVSSGEGPPTRQPAGDTKPSWMILREQMHEELKKGVTNNRSDGSDVLPSPYESDGLAPSRSGSSGSGRAGSSSPHVWERKATVWPLPGLPTRSPTWPQRLGRGNEDSEGSVASTGSAVSPRQKVPRSNRDPHGAFNLLSRSAQPSASMPQPLNIVKARAESLKQEYVGFSAEDASEFEVLSSALVEAVGPEIVPVARQLLPGLKGKFEYLQQKIWALQGTIADMRNAEKEVYSLTSRASLAAAAALETKLTILEARLQASEKARRELALVPLGSSVNAARFQLPEPTNVEQLMQQNQQLTQQAWELTQQNHALTHENQAFLDTCQRLGAAIEDRDLVLFRQKTNLNEEEYQNRQSFLKAYLRALREVSRMELEHIWLMDRVLVLEGNRSEFRLEDYQNLANRRAGLLNRIAELRDLVSQNRGTSMAAAWTQQIDACNDELDMASAEMAPLHEQFRLLTGQQCNYDESIIRDINGRGAEMIGVPDPLARSAMEKLGNHVFSICQDLQDLGSQPNASDAFAMISAFGGGYEDPVTRRMCYQHLIWSMLVELVFEGCLWAGSVRAEARAILAFLSGEFVFCLAYRNLC